MPGPSARVSVLGAGSWGTALAALASHAADALLWARNAAQADEINGGHSNTRYLPGIVLPESLAGTSDFTRAVHHACPPGQAPGLIILGVPVAGLEEVCTKLAQALPRQTSQAISVIWTCKGLHPQTGQLPHEIAQAAFQSRSDIELGVLSGPSFAREVAQGLPFALTIASASARVCEQTRSVLHGTTARIYASTDIVGVEVGGALKNVMAIACGVSDGLGLGTNARAALITRGLAEMSRLGVAMGGQAATFSGLAGLGDLVLTATGDLSRNRQVGVALGQGQSLEQILAGGMTAEGVRCARAVLDIGRQHGIDLPITEAVCNVLFTGMLPAQAVTELLARDARDE